MHLTPHQWRHTFATRLINRDVPQEVVRVLLDHDSHQMTAHYARLHDQTIRHHWERARKVNIEGEEVVLDPEGPLAQAAWAKQRLGRVTQALPNGFCGLPLQQSCPHANACLTCPMFVTTPAFLPQHRHQCQQLLQLVSAAEARGQLRVVEMNRQVLSNLDRIIAALESDDPDADEGEGVPMRADNSRFLVQAARRRSQATRERAIQALRRLVAGGAPVTFDAVARTAGVSRSWLYAQADLRLEIGRLRARQQEHQRAPNGPPIPARQRASDASLRQRLEATNTELRRLRHDNQQLREQLAWTLGERRAAQLHGQPDAPGNRGRAGSTTIGPCS